jgi:hypothetical protein
MSRNPCHAGWKVRRDRARGCVTETNAASPWPRGRSSSSARIQESDPSRALPSSSPLPGPTVAPPHVRRSFPGGDVGQRRARARSEVLVVALVDRLSGVAGSSTHRLPVARPTGGRIPRVAGELPAAVRYPPANEALAGVRLLAPSIARRRAVWPARAQPFVRRSAARRGGCPAAAESACSALLRNSSFQRPGWTWARSLESMKSISTRTKRRGSSR